LISQILTGTTLTPFTGDGSGYLDVAGGAAAPYFGTRTFANAFDPTGFSDFSLTSDFSSGPYGGHPSTE
jgi:hypothetical protein